MYSYLKQKAVVFIDFLVLLILAVLLDIYIFAGGYIIYATHFSPGAKAQHVYDIYHKLTVASGQPESVPSLTILPVKELNAITTSSGIYIYQGLLDKLTNDDEIALVLAHEMSHALLRYLTTRDNVPTRVEELQADKYGSALMMEAGYNICKGRESFRILKEAYGDSMMGDHPSDAFRIDELNVRCDKSFFDPYF